MTLRRVGLHLTDLHCGAKHGAASSTTKLDGAPLGLSQVQIEIEKHFFNIIERVIAFAAGDPVDIHVTGDVCNGNTHMATEPLYSPDPERQAVIAADFLGYLRLIDTLDSISLTYGTLAHDWAESGATNMVGEKLVSMGFPGVSVSAHGAAWYDDVFVDSGHAGPAVAETSIRNYLNGTRPGREGIVTVCLEENRAIPHLVLRGHRHIGYRYVYNYKVLGQQRNLIYLSGFPMCGINDYSRQVANQPQRFAIGTWMWEQTSTGVNVGTVEAITHTFDTRSVSYRGSARADGRGCLAHVRRGAGNFSKGDGEMG